MIGMIGTIIMAAIAIHIEYKRQKLEMQLDVVKSENYSLKLVMAQEGLIPKEYAKK